MRLIDGMNYIRRVFEKDVSGRAPRTILNEQLVASDTVIWCWDPPGAKATRQQLLPEYKAKRLPPPENIWPIISLIKEALEHTPALQIQVPRFEADDVIASLCRRFPNEKKFIVSNDADLRQLLVVPNTDIEAKPPKFEVAPKHVRLFKTCVGDPSDNISGVPGFGRKTWESINHALLQENINAVLTGGIPQLDDLPGLPTRCRTWMKENPQKIKDTWACVGLWEVPVELIDRHTIVGRRDPVKVSEILAPFYL